MFRAPGELAMIYFKMCFEVQEFYLGLFKTAGPGPRGGRPPFLKAGAGRCPPAAPPAA
jgi:hypothetical protein